MNNNLKKTLLVLGSWLMVSIGLYLFMNPLTVQQFKDYVTGVVISGIAMIIVLYVSGLNEKAVARILSIDKVLNDLSISDKLLLRIENLNKMVIILSAPIDGGKKQYIEYLIYTGKYIGGVGRTVVNCMSDLKNSATDISRDSRVMGFDFKPMSSSSAKSLLNSAQRTSIDKIYSAAREVERIGQKGGTTALQTTQDMIEKEENRFNNGEEGD